MLNKYTIKDEQVRPCQLRRRTLRPGGTKLWVLCCTLSSRHPLHLDSFWLQASGTPLLKTVLWALSICMGLARRAGKLTPFKCNRKERMISRSWKINISVSLPLKWNHSEPSSTFSPKGRQCNSAPPAHSSDLLINTPLIGLLPLSFFHLHCLPLLLGITSEIN